MINEFDELLKNSAEENQKKLFEGLVNFYSLEHKDIKLFGVNEENLYEVEQLVMSPIAYQMILYTTGSLKYLAEIAGMVELVPSLKELNLKVLEFADPGTAEIKQQIFDKCLESIQVQERIPVLGILPAEFQVSLAGIKDESVFELTQQCLSRETESPLFHFLRKVLFLQLGLWCLSPNLTRVSTITLEDYGREVNVHFKKKHMIITDGPYTYL